MEKYPVSYISRLRMGSDGEGIRTLIIFQQCPLRCKYCINPFTWDGSRMPKMMTANEIYEYILIDRPYLLATNGGVTFGGGEPLLHSKAIKEFADINEERFSIYIETSLNVSLQNLSLIVNDIDMYFVDIKAAQEEVYKSYTGGNLQIAIDNLKYLLQTIGADRVVVRIPIIPGMTGESEQEQSKKYLEELGVRHFDLFTYKVPGRLDGDS